MKYYKVPASMDQKKCYKPNTTHRIPNGYFLIANELLTLSECKRINAPINKLFPIEIKKTQTYFFFGARFEVKTLQEA